MYEVFNVSTIEKDIRNRTITITTTSDVDPETVNEKNVAFLEKATKEIPDYTLTVKQKQIILTLKEWPKPNTEYILKVSKLLNVVGDPLSQRIRRTVIFPSSVTSFVKILSPVHGETISRFSIKLEELASKEEELLNSFLVEIATDANFHRIVKTLKLVDQSEVNIDFMEPEQYYIRSRVQFEKEGLEYGLWSEVTSIRIMQHDCESEIVDPGFGVPHPEDGFIPPFEPDLDPVYIEDLEILTYPENGATPETILIGFNDYLSEQSLGEVIIIRRDY